MHGLNTGADDYVQILRLRRKLEIDPSAPELIRTERGVGYVFDAPVQAF